MRKSPVAKGKVEGTISKRKMVEQAVQELGDAKPKELHGFIQQKHGIDMSLQMISSYKSNLKKGSGGLSVGKISDSATVNLRDIALLQQLMERVGPQELQTLIRVLGKSQAPAE